MTPTFDQLTLNNGTSSSCRVDIGPNVADPTFPIEFTIRNPDGRYMWASDTSSGAFLREPPNGIASAAGPHRAVVRFFSQAGAVSGDTITQTFTLQMRRSSDNSLAASCGIAVWGFMKPER